MEEGHICYLTKAIELLSKRWTLFVFHKLLEGPLRFSEIEGCLPISGRLLSERLKELEALELVNRRIYPEVPVRVEYELTDIGKAIGPVIMEIQKWASVWNSSHLKTCATIDEGICGADSLHKGELIDG
jgi:DNA-binding HxlR family transcriptional regulator